MKIKEFQTQIEELNDYAIEKLNEKGADISADASTFQIINSFLTLDNHTEEIENLIDESGVLDSTEGSVSEKVEQLIDKANKVDFCTYITNARQIFQFAKSFPTKAVVNLLNATDVYQAFASWNSTTGPIPVVEELTVNAPNINVASNQACMGQMFSSNQGVEKVVLNMPNESQYMNSTFASASNLKEVALEFSTNNIKDYASSFANCKKLKKIIGVLDFSSATNVSWMFASCTDLNEVTFEPNTLSISISLNGSGNLFAKSIQSIINGLSASVTGKTLTLLETAVNKAFETEEGANNGSTEESSEWFNLIATKPDWTITLL